MPGFNLADLFERVVDAVPEREVIVSPARRLTYRELDDRANALAHVLTDLGIKAGDHIGLQLLNGSEYLEGMLAAFKLSAVPVNINFRYVEGELRHLYDDADLVAVIHHRQFGSRVAAAADGATLLQHLISVEDGSGADAAPGAHRLRAGAGRGATGRPDGTSRSGDDHYIAYTGGTTGLPKGVVWRQEDIFFAAMGGGDLFQSGNFITTPDELVERIPEIGGTILTTPPLMHVSAQWGVFPRCSPAAGSSSRRTARSTPTPSGRSSPAKASTSSRSSATRWRNRSPTRCSRHRTRVRRTTSPR